MHLSDSLSNLSTPLLRLITALDQHGGLAKMQVKPNVQEPSLVQASAEDPSLVRLAVKENRLLSPAEVGKLVEAYCGGETMRALARQFGLDRNTVSRHLERAKVAKRPTVKMTVAVVAHAQQLYEQGWSTQRIGRELGASPSTVYKALKRAGVRMRAPVARNPSAR